MNCYYTALVSGIGKSGDIGVVFPDFPGCVAQAGDLDSALISAKDALEFHLESMVEDGDDIPLKSDQKEVEQWIKDAEDDGEPVQLSIMQVALPELKAKRINVSMSGYILDKVDRWAEAHGRSRSDVLAQGALDYIQCHA